MATLCEPFRTRKYPMMRLCKGIGISTETEHSTNTCAKRVDEMRTPSTVRKWMESRRLCSLLSMGLRSEWWRQGSGSRDDGEDDFRER